MSRRPAIARPLLLDLVFAALADATRREIVARLRDQEATVSELAAPLDMSLAGASKHLQVLEKAGLLKRRIAGRTHFLSVDPKPLDEAMSWIERQRRFWNTSFDRLAELVEKPSPPKTKENKTKPSNL
jgi:DNA-binding transcriptional ArsR family regulator